MELDERLMIGYWFTDITAYSFSQYKRILFRVEEQYTNL